MPPTCLLVALVLTVGVRGTILAQSDPPLPPPGSIVGSEGNRVAVIRAAGIAKDKSKESYLLQILNKPDDWETLQATMLALSHMGSVSALAGIERWTRLKTGPELAAYARVIRARILAEAQAAAVSDPIQRATVTFDRFTNELGLTLPKWIQDVQKHLDEQRYIIHGDVGAPFFAIQILADMVYFSRDGALAEVARLRGVRFEVEPGAALKTSIALLGSQSRILFLTEQLAAKGVLTPDADYLVQLAVDEGATAGEAAAEKLREMRTARTRYKPAGFRAMFSILSGLGDSRHTDLVASFLEDSDKSVSHGARIANDYVPLSIRRVYKNGY